MSISIRLATPADYDKIADMAMSLPQKIAPAVIRMMTDTNQFSVRTVIAEQNNQLLGYIGFRIINAQVKSVNFELMKHDYHPFMKGDEF